MITISNLSVEYQQNKPVLEHLNLQLGEHKIHGLVGLNGSGKTTLLNTIYGLLKPVSGEIKIDEHPINKKQIGYLEAENYFYSNINGEEYLSLFQNKNFDIKSWNQIFELPLQTLIENYSTGMKRKLALLGVLKLDKSILILDEPFNSLDMETSKVLQIIIMRLKEKGKTILITSHILESLTNICDEIHFLEKGQIKFSRMKDNFAGLDKDIFDNFSKQELINELV